MIVYSEALLATSIKSTHVESFAVFATATATMTIDTLQPFS